MPLWESEAQQEQEMHLGINPSCSKQTKKKGQQIGNVGCPLQDAGSVNALGGWGNGSRNP